MTTILSLIFLFLLSQNSYSAEYEDSCDMLCYFTDPYITAENYRNWPKWCRSVCGDLIVNEHTNVSYSDLEKTFQNLEWLYGDLKVENTPYKTLSFLTSLRQYGCNSGEFILSNNSELIDLQHISELKASRGMCIWTVTNNKKLDFTAFMDSAIRSQAELNVYGNLKNTGCQGVRITKNTLPDYPNCTSITGGYTSSLVIRDLDENLDLSPFLLLKEISGSIFISNTVLENVSFLENLRTIVPEAEDYSPSIYIVNNPNMTRLGLDDLERIGTVNAMYEINVGNNHPDFCFTTKEIQVLGESQAKLSGNFEIAPCAGVPRKDGQKVCYLENLSTLETDCQHVIGDVSINSTNEKHVSNLKTMTHIYGTLKIEGTEELTDLSFLTNFRQLASTDRIYEPVIRINSNKKLQKVSFPSMKTPPFPFSEKVMIRIDNNKLDIFKTRQECEALEEQTQTPVKYNAKGCDKLPSGS